MDRKTLLAIGLSLIVFVGWQKFYIEPRLPKVQQTQATSVQNTAPAAGNTAPVGGGSAQPVAPKAITVKSTEIRTAIGPAYIGDAGKFFTDWKISQYRTTSDPKSPIVDLAQVTQNSGGEGELAFDAPELAYANNVQGTMVQTESGATWTYEDANLKLKREYSYGAEKNEVDLVLSAEFKTKKPTYAFVSVSSHTPEGDHELADRQLLAYQGTALERLHLKDVKQVQDMPGTTKWIAAQNRYFLLTLIPAEPASRVIAQSTGPNSAKVSLLYPVLGNSIRIPLKAYFGPKEMNKLHAVEPSLDLTIDFGWFTFFAYPILKVMKWINQGLGHFNGGAGNWGIAIILLTLLIKLLTYPLTLKSSRSMKKIAALQPQMNALRDKYKDDKEALNREMITFMKTQGYNPVAGCLPIIIQMPVFFALYRVLYSSIELYQAPFFGWIHDLSLKDPYYITPVILTGVMWLQQKLTPSTATDPMQAKMLQYMPVFFGLMMLNLPAGLTLYMLVNAAASVVQQRHINKNVNV